jgi:putative thioredoxin
MDVTERDFEARVVERSAEVPVVVDFWAAWCGPCRTLTPALEKAIAARNGAVELAKVDVDSEQTLAAAFGIRGIPAVKAFRDRRIAAEFTGAIPPAQIEQFLDRLVPSEADQLVAAGDEASLRAALKLDPRHTDAAVKLGRLLMARGDTEGALELLEPLAGSFLAEGLVARIRLTPADPESELAGAFRAWDDGESEDALEALQDEIAGEEDPERRDLLRAVMVAIFTELGADSPLARTHRRRLASALS